MQIEIPHGKGKGHWNRVIVDELGDNPRWGAIVWCPDCGRGLFARDHKIDDNGQISPSLGHPAEYPPCGWHTNPRLLDWAPVPPQPQPRAMHTCASCGCQSRAIGGWGTHGAFTGIICPKCIAASHTAPASTRTTKT